MTTTAHPAEPTEATRDDAVDLAHVPGQRFTPRGKWKYDVDLDYTGLDINHWNLGATAQQALAAATHNHTPRVAISELGGYWTLVVINPPGRFSHPVMVIGSDSRRA